MEQNTSKAIVADDGNLAATLLNATGSGTSLFVINLCASMAPIANAPKALPGLEQYRIYQVTRREDGRTRYRLRLGFFATEADAEAVLNIVRVSYPTAFTTCLSDEDKKFTRGYVVEPVTPKMTVVENRAHATAAGPARPASAPNGSPAGSPSDTNRINAASIQAAAPKNAAPAAAAKKAATQPGASASAPASKAQPAPTSAPTSASTAQEEAVEIELSWEPPELKASPATPEAPAAQVVAPAFKTQEVIKAPEPPKAKEPSTKSEVQPQKPTKRTIEAPSKLLADVELTLEPESAARAKKPEAPVGSNEPFRVGRGAEIPDTSLSLEATATHRALATQPKAPPKTTQTAHTKPAAVSQTTNTPPTAPNVGASKPALAVGPSTDKLPDIDSTQTIRALTSDELADESKEKWYAIQLAISDQPVNLDAMPRLDIFEAYRLYSVATAGSGKITHSLRLGFFREEISAEAVCGYLKTFFAAPTVVRISIAEHARFKDPPAPKSQPKAEVLDLSQARDRGPKHIPTVTMEVETPRSDTSATGTFKTSATGVHKALSASGTHRALGTTGTYKSPQSASKSSPPATKRSGPLSKSPATGKHKALRSTKSLEEQLLEEAREMELSASGIRKLPKNNSLIAKMFRLGRD
ncbi:MAG TPA: SPOR domain-containing protein [Steroidobacteraceae bacterium]